MSSSNRIKIAGIPELVYGVVPGVGNFQTFRPISESLNGSVDVAESQQIRSDRQPPGQVAVGLSVGGDLPLELCKESEIEGLMRSAMFNDWATSALVTADFDIDATAKTITLQSGSLPVGVKVGDVVKLAGFANATNNVPVQIAELVAADTWRFVGPSTMVTEVAPAGLTTFKPLDKLEVGTSLYSYSLIKIFEDLTTKAINYRGQIVNQMAINVAYGEIVKTTFSFVGNGYQPVSAAADFISNGHAFNPPATSLPMNGSIDMPFLATSSEGTFDQSTFCIQSLELTLNNNLQPQNCIGRAAPQAYTPGSSTVDISISSYLFNENWSLLQRKLDQTSFGIGFVLKNGDGYYGFYIPAVQVSFDDPAAGGPNQDVTLSMTGKAKVGPNQEKVLYIYRGV